jgi:hypothetical protein
MKVCQKDQTIRVGTGQYFEWIKGFSACEKRIVINLIPVRMEAAFSLIPITVKQENQFH